jgi:hypothetical protein
MSGTIGDNVFRASGVIAAAAAGGVSWQSVETGTTFTAVAGNGYPVNTTSNACTVTLPAAASVGDEIIFTDYLRTWATNNLTINPNSLNYQGSIHIVYVDATQGWTPTYDGAVAFETPQTVSVDYLVVAGGGSGGLGDSGGGGGAGGMLVATSFLLTSPNVYTISVGAGGAGGASPGNSGADSSIAGAGITTVTAVGGGMGADNSNYAAIGGSGGGGADNGTTYQAGYAGTAGQGNAGGDGLGPGGGTAGGGGGGKGAVGTDAYTAGPAPSVLAGPGGNGTADSITGSAVTYAGGGGGGSNYVPAVGTGGSGGGGSGDKTPGTDGLGGGGGAEGPAAGGGGDGGDGIVIIRVLTADIGTASGEDSSTVDGSYTYITWLNTAGGTYTA